MKKILIVLLALSIIIIFSCKKSTESDNNPPTIEITFPANNSECILGEIIIILADAQDDEGVEKVEFYINGTMVSTDTSQPYEYEWDTGLGKNDNFTIYAKAFDTNNNSTNSESINVMVCDNGTVTDIDGNVYQTKIFGNQEWMIENLKVTHYRNGDSIPNLTDGNAWAIDVSGAYCYYDNDNNNSETYGALYNWFAVDNSCGLAPEGWHVPSDNELKELEMFVGMTQAQADEEGWRGTNEASKLAGNKDLWYDYEDGITSNDAFGSSGFEALPCGLRNSDDGSFGYMTQDINLWSSTSASLWLAWTRELFCQTSMIGRSDDNKNYGYAVRCVKD